MAGEAKPIADLVAAAAAITDPATGDGAPTWSVVDLWDFGVAADITPPGPDELVPPRDAYREGPATAPDRTSQPLAARCSGG